MNRLLIMGRLTKDPEVRPFKKADGTDGALAKFSIAVNRKQKREGQPDADFFNCTAFGKLGEFVKNYLKKGVKVVVIGSIQNDNYEDKDGKMQYSVQVICDEIEFAESKGNGSGNAATSDAAPAEAPAMPEPAPAASLDDELPFA